MLPNQRKRSWSILIGIAAAVFAYDSAASPDDNRFTPPSEIPPYKAGDVIHTEGEFREFLDLMLTATGPRHAFEIAQAKFGGFPLRFGGDHFRIMIVSFRHHVIHPHNDCTFPMIKAEYVRFDPKAGTPTEINWMMIYPRTGPILAGDIHAREGNVMREGQGGGPDIEAFCKEARKPLSYSRY